MISANRRQAQQPQVTHRHAQHGRGGKRQRRPRRGGAQAQPEAKERKQKIQVAGAQIQHAAEVTATVDHRAEPQQHAAGDQSQVKVRIVRQPHPIGQESREQQQGSVPRRRRRARGVPVRRNFRLATACCTPATAHRLTRESSAPSTSVKSSSRTSSTGGLIRGTASPQHSAQLLAHPLLEPEHVVLFGQQIAARMGRRMQSESGRVHTPHRPPPSPEQRNRRRARCPPRNLRASPSGTAIRSRAPSSPGRAATGARSARDRRATPDNAKAGWSCSGSRCAVPRP